VLRRLRPVRSLLLLIGKAEIFGQVEGTLRDPIILKHISNNTYLSWELTQARWQRIQAAPQRPNRAGNDVDFQLVAARGPTVRPDFEGVRPRSYRESNRLPHRCFSDPDFIDEDSPSDVGDTSEYGSLTSYFDHGLTSRDRGAHSASIAEGCHRTPDLGPAFLTQPSPRTGLGGCLHYASEQEGHA
jgi:hypothetical protein